MMNKLTPQEIALILESLKYSKLKFEEYQGYPSEDFRKQKVEEVNNLVQKIKTLNKNNS